MGLASLVITLFFYIEATLFKRDQAISCWGELGGASNILDQQALIDLFHHLQACSATISVVSDWWEGSISDVTPDPMCALTADMSCPHGSIKNFCCSTHADLSEVIEWLKSNERIR